MPNGIERSFSSRSRSAESLVQSVFMAASLDDRLATTLISARLVDEREQSRAVSRRTSRPAVLFQDILAARAARARIGRRGERASCRHKGMQAHNVKKGIHRKRRGKNVLNAGPRCR